MTNPDLTTPASSSETVENSVSPTPPASTRKPRVVKSPPGLVIGGGLTDDVLLSRLALNGPKRKSLSVVHLQRRLGELGFSEATAEWIAIPGVRGPLTVRAVHAWQAANGYPESELTGEQATVIFEHDRNVTVVVDI